MAEVVRFLRRERETAACEASLAHAEAARLRAEAAHLRRELEGVRSVARQAEDRARALVRVEADHTALLQQLDQLTLLRESNAALRCGQLGTLRLTVTIALGNDEANGDKPARWCPLYACY